MLDNNINQIQQINSKPNLTNVNIRPIKQEAMIQLPLEEEQNFINNGITKLVETQNIKQLNSNLAYNQAFEKSIEMIKGLSSLLLEAFNKVNLNLVI